ncbi:MAG TPA: hypothetical protein VF525_18430 [Pyrinomonadaceae bacterium]|jgi:hypothetical protein
MRSKRSVPGYRRLAALSGYALLACCLSAVVLAQSGRRQPPSKPEAPVPTPTPEPAKIKPTPPPEIRVLFTNSAPPSVHLSNLDAKIVADTFVQRLHASKSLKVETADRMSRDAARKRAKTEETRYVIWLELQPNGMDVDAIGMNRPNAEDLHIQYIVFQPGTGQIWISGNVYLRPVSSLPGGRVVLDCYPNRYLGLDGALMAGAIETADRIFDALSVPIPPLCPTS